MNSYTLNSDSESRSTVIDYTLSMIYAICVVCLQHQRTHFCLSEQNLCKFITCSKCSLGTFYCNISTIQTSIIWWLNHIFSSWTFSECWTTGVMTFLSCLPTQPFQPVDISRIKRFILSSRRFGWRAQRSWNACDFQRDNALLTLKHIH